MSRFDAIVIGGGVNGLVAAAVLGRRGKSVCLIERSGRLGGMAGAEGAYPRMAHLLHNLGPLVRRDIGLGPGDWPFRTVALPTVALAPGGGHVRIDGAEARFADGRPHPDAAAYRALVTRLRDYGALLRRLAEAPPPGGEAAWADPAALKQMLRLGGFGRALRQMGRAEMRTFLKVLLSNAHDLILDEMPDGPLAGALAADAVRGLALGPRSPGTVFSLIYRHGHGGTVSLPVGGMAAVIAALAGAAEAAAVTIRTGTAAARLLCEGDRAIGVETDTGEVVMARRVLSSTSPLAAARMAGLDRFDIEATRRMRLVRARGTVAKINLHLSALPRIDGLPDDLLGARLLLAPRPRRWKRRSIRRNTAGCRTTRSSRRCCPASPIPRRRAMAAPRCRSSRTTRPPTSPAAGPTRRATGCSGRCSRGSPPSRPTCPASSPGQRFCAPAGSRRKPARPAAIGTMRT